MGMLGGGGGREMGGWKWNLRGGGWKVVGGGVIRKMWGWKGDIKVNCLETRRRFLQNLKWKFSVFYGRVGANNFLRHWLISSSEIITYVSTMLLYFYDQNRLGESSKKPTFLHVFEREWPKTYNFKKKRKNLILRNHFCFNKYP